MKILFCHTDKCLACKSCELACATEHSKSKELIAALREQPLPAHRVRVFSIEQQEGKARPGGVALQCRQCDDPACVEACIAGGIVKDEATGVVSFNQEKCVGCWSCVMVCPYGAIVRMPGGGYAVKCDRCPDREIPACVEACPTHALVLCEENELEEFRK